MSTQESASKSSESAAPAGTGMPQFAAAPGDQGGATASVAPAAAAPTASAGAAFSVPLFQVPSEVVAPAPRRRERAKASGSGSDSGSESGAGSAAAPDADADDGDEEGSDGQRRRRRRGGRGRRPRKDGETEGGDSNPEVEDEAAGEGTDAAGEASDQDASGEDATRRRRRRRRRDGEPGSEDEPAAGGRARESRRGSSDSSARLVAKSGGSTRIDAKKQRRRDGREAGRRRVVVTEAEFLARRESVSRIMVVREREGRIQIAVLEDGVLVEHYVAQHSQTTLVGNVYLGKVQNVLPSMEAAFVDIGKGRNAVLYAGEVNWDAAGLDGVPRRIEHALKTGEPVLVQVTKDPIGHKGARLTSQVSLAGRYLVYVPNASMTGISRKLPDTERQRLKQILREVVPADAGVIVRTAAEGASEEELKRDVARLAAQWEDINSKAGAVAAPAMLYGEPDLAIRVVRDIFNEDFTTMVVSGDQTWETIHAYVSHVAPDLVGRLERRDAGADVFAEYRVDEQLAKALDRKVFLPSGGSLVIDRTEAMTVVDVNTGRFIGSGGNLEETVTKNNLEAAEEIVRQLRLRDIGGIIVVDFIDMVMETNRDLVLRRLLECLGRDRTKHQVSEVTSLGLVQMTRKRVGQGLVEAFSEPCQHCNGRGLILHDEPVAKPESNGALSVNTQLNAPTPAIPVDAETLVGATVSPVRHMPTPSAVAAATGAAEGQVANELTESGQTPTVLTPTADGAVVAAGGVADGTAAEIPIAGIDDTPATADAEAGTGSDGSATAASSSIPAPVPAVESGGRKRRPRVVTGVWSPGSTSQTEES